MNIIEKIKHGGGKMRLTSLMVIFLISGATGWYCHHYSRLLLLAVRQWAYCY